MIKWSKIITWPNNQNKIVTAIVGDSIIRDVYGWELSEREEELVVKHFSRLTTEDMKNDIQPPLKRDLTK